MCARRFLSVIFILTLIVVAGALAIYQWGGNVLLKEWLPKGADQSGSGGAAVFFVHPTTYLERDRWNAPLFVGGDTEFRTNLFVQSQASAFNGTGEVWAPRYRQAAFGAFLLDSKDATAALDFAY